MDNQPHDVIPPIELPRPEVGQLPVPQEMHQNSPTAETGASKAVEQNIPSASIPVVQDGQSPAVTPLQPPSPPHVIPGMTLSTDPASMTGTPSIADDADLIEKEWVEKAKEIVARTRDDPHTQNKEINKMKADYLKKRYNKDLKLSEQ